MNDLFKKELEEIEKNHEQNIKDIFNQYVLTDEELEAERLEVLAKQKSK